MYTQSFNVPEQGEVPSSAGLKAVPKVLSAQDAALQAQFDARIDANGNLQSAQTPTESGADLFALTATEVNFALRAALRLNEEVPSPGALRQIDRFALPEVEARFVAAIADGHNPLLKDG